MARSHVELRGSGREEKTNTELDSIASLIRPRRPRDIALQSLGSQNMQNYEHFEHVRLAFALPLMVPRIGVPRDTRPAAVGWLTSRARACYWRCLFKATLRRQEDLSARAIPMTRTQSLRKQLTGSPSPAILVGRTPKAMPGSFMAAGLPRERSRCSWHLSCACGKGGSFPATFVDTVACLDVDISQWRRRFARLVGKAQSWRMCSLKHSGCNQKKAPAACAHLCMVSHCSQSPLPGFRHVAHAT